MTITVSKIINVVLLITAILEGWILYTKVNEISYFKESVASLETKVNGLTAEVTKANEEKARTEGTQRNIALIAEQCEIQRLQLKGDLKEFAQNVMQCSEAEKQVTEWLHKSKEGNNK